jgi:hypothetical protein
MKKFEITCAMDDDTLAELRREVERSEHPAACPASTNPFLLPEAAAAIGGRERDKMRRNAERASLMQMSLISRANLQRPPVPPCVLRRSNPAQSALAPLLPGPSSEQRAARARRMTEFLHEKREMFLLQLIIDGQRREIQKIRDSMAHEERALVEDEVDIEVRGKEYKRYEVELEAKLSAILRAAEMATQLRVELQTRLKRATAAVITTKYEIEKNCDLLDEHRQYAAFLKMMTPDNFLTSDYFDRAEKMIECLDDLEKQNLLLMQTRQFFNEKAEVQSRTIEEAGRDSSAEIERFEQVLRDLPAPVEEAIGLSAGTVEQSRQLDEAYDGIAGRVKASYRACFHRESEMSPLRMLMELEARLEQFASTLETIDPAFVAQKQSEQERRRRDEQRIRKQIRQEEEQKMKIEHAFARATRPIQKRSGRPLVPRTLPQKAHAGIDYAQLAALEEQRRIDEMLYGEIT